MFITDANREKLSHCCQMRYDFYIELENSQKTPNGNISMRAMDGDLYKQFWAFVIGSVLLENTIKKNTCLDCLHFRHVGLNYYSKFKKQNETEKLKEILNKK